MIKHKNRPFYAKTELRKPFRICLILESVTRIIDDFFDYICKQHSKYVIIN